jgi:hypothetical protein
VVQRVFSHKGTIPTRLSFCEPLDPEQMDRKRMATVSRQLIVDALDASDARDPRLYPAQ